jgi:hypothetical protein
MFINIKLLAWTAMAAGLVLLAGAAMLPAAGTTAAVIPFAHDLVGAEENPPVTGPGKARGEFYFDDVEKTISYFVTITGVAAADVTGGHIHRAPRGSNGPIIIPFTSPDGKADGVTYYAGTAKMTDADIADLRAGNLYANVHSKANPGGFARAQLSINQEDAIRMSLRATADAWNKKDVERFLLGFTDAGLMEEFGFPDRATAREELPFFIGSDPVSIYSLTNLQVTSGSAVGDLTLQVGVGLESDRKHFVFQDGIWKMDTGEAIRSPVPSGFTVVNMQLQEFAFVYDKSRLSSGRFAIDYDNIGKQEHEVVLLRFNSTAPLLDYFRTINIESEEIPAELEFIAARAPIAPGEDGNLVFTEALSPGRYVFVCFFPDEEELPEYVPHIAKGMLSDFFVGAGPQTGGPQVQPVVTATPAGGVRPPSTGDGGLVGGSPSDARIALIGLALVALVGGAGGLAFAVRRTR